LPRLHRSGTLHGDVTHGRDRHGHDPHARRGFRPPRIDARGRGPRRSVTPFSRTIPAQHRRRAGPQGSTSAETARQSETTQPRTRTAGQEHEPLLDKGAPARRRARPLSDRATGRPARRGRHPVAPEDRRQECQRRGGQAPHLAGPLLTVPPRVASHRPRTCHQSGFALPPSNLTLVVVPDREVAASSSARCWRTSSGWTCAAMPPPRLAAGAPAGGLRSLFRSRRKVPLGDRRSR
jgi:hypothetical protein